jgi:integrase
MTRKQHWKATKTQYLCRLGKWYYIRVRVGKNVIRESLDTDVLSVAQERLPGRLRELREQPAAANTVASLVEEYKRKIQADADLEPGSVEYKEYSLEQIAKCWLGFHQLRIGNLRKAHFTDCRNNLARQYSRTRANGGITVLRELVALAVDHGWIPKGNDLMEDCNWVKDKTGKLKRRFPTATQWAALRGEIIRHLAHGGTIESLNLFDLLTLSGCRVQSARHLRWRDIDWEREIVVFHKAKRGAYEIPLFPELRELLERIRNARGGSPDPASKVIGVKSIRCVLKNAAAAIPGMGHVSHHTCRHAFATRCLEQDPPVSFALIAEWLGHGDGGKLVMSTYGHITEQHSQERAKTLRIMEPAAQPVQTASSSKAATEAPHGGVTPTQS